MSKKSVFNKQIAQQLCKRGFKIIEVQPNNHKPWLNVYYFEYTPELITAFTEIMMDHIHSK